MRENDRGTGAFLPAVMSIVVGAILPALLLFSTLHYLLTDVDFYTRLVKRMDLVASVVELNNARVDARVRDELEGELGLHEFEKKAEYSRVKFEKARDFYDRLNKTRDYMELENTIRMLDQKASGGGNSSAEKEMSAARLKLREIESYREHNEAAIDGAYLAFGAAREEMDKAEAEYDERNAEGLRIAKKHRGTLSVKFNEDMEMLGPRLRTILDERIIDGALRRELAKHLEFITAYGKQKAGGNVSHDKGTGEPLVRLPRHSLSLWVEDEVGGVRVKRHLLSQVFVDEIRKAPSLRNRALLLGLFRMSDSGIGEYFSGRYLKKAGLTLNEGIIQMRPMELRGSAAKKYEWIMIGASYGGLVKYAGGLLFMLFVLYMFFSRANPVYRRAWFKRALLYPSLTVILLSLIMLALSKFLFDVVPFLLPDAATAGLASVAFKSLAVSLCIPVIIVFAIPALAGFLAGLAGRGSGRG